MKKQIVEVNGVSCEVIATYTDPKTAKNYIVYTDKTFNNLNKLNVYCGLYKIINGKINVLRLQTKEDELVALKILKEVINTI